MKEFKYIFIILVYRNTDDLEECIQSIFSFVSSFKIIVVNSYYDDESREAARAIAKQYECDFLNVENRGYSYGNNEGIRFARDNYSFDFIIVSNPDIIIRKFDDSFLDNQIEFDVVAPEIIAADGRSQNPMYVSKPRFVTACEYVGFKCRLKPLIQFGILLSKLKRFYYSRKYTGKSQYLIYGAHGSFVIMSRRAVEALDPVYDNNMFLFAEEMVLAAKSRAAGLKTCYYNGISISHKEDGSMKLSNLKMFDELRKSNLYYYENYEKKNKLS